MSEFIIGFNSGDSVALSGQLLITSVLDEGYTLDWDVEREGIDYIAIVNQPVTEEAK